MDSVVGQAALFARLARARESLGPVVERTLAGVFRAAERRDLHRLKSWVVGWLESCGVPRGFAVGAVAGLHGHVSPIQAVGMLSAYRLVRVASRRSMVGRMITGARRRWVRRVSDDEIRAAHNYADCWLEATPRPVFHGAEPQRIGEVLARAR